jgi:hypothetical protein
MALFVMICAAVLPYLFFPVEEVAVRRVAHRPAGRRGFRKSSDTLPSSARDKAPQLQGKMTAQPARIDLADLGPGIAWAFEFDENGGAIA